MTTKTVKKKAPPKKTANTTKKTKVDEPSLNIIQTSKCQTISNKSTLTYNLGVDDKNNIFIRINGNTGGGFLSNEWISLENITSILGEIPGDQSISSLHLFPLFKGKSVNTPAFLLAALLNEGVLVTPQEKKRHYAYSGVEAFLAKVAKKL